MSLFNSENEAENFKKQLIQYFNLKQEQKVVNVLHHSKLECTWYSHDNWDGGFDIYKLDLEIPIGIYVKQEDELDELTTKIGKAANNLIPDNDQIGPVSFLIQQNSIDQAPNKSLLAVVEKVKTSLIAKATGQNPDDNEYKIYRKILLDTQQLKAIIPSFVKHYSNLAEFWTYIQPKYPTYRLRREHIIEEFKPLILLIENPTQSPIHANTKEKLSKLSSESVHQLWLKAIDRLNGDSDGAITVASTLLEDTIKSILNDFNIEYSDEKDKLPKLYGLLANKLNLSPSQHIEEIFKQILGGCRSIVQGLGSLRNKIGDAHARGKRPVKPALRHAELAVNLAGAMATFLIATWENSKKLKD